MRVLTFRSQNTVYDTMKQVSTLLALTLLLAGCASGQDAPEAMPPMGETVAVDGGQYRDVGPTDLQTMMTSYDVPVINVHVQDEGDIDGTDDSIPFDQIESHLDRLPEDKDAPIVLYCRSGRMSAEAATALVRNGYTNVYNLVGGFRAWSEAGLPMEGS